MAKAKISVTVHPALLESAEQLAPGASRSEVFERALEHWVRHARSASLAKETEAYYPAQRDDERQEDEQWAELAAAHIDESWS
jgi:metal-responsive CopG/Arc/MetJ family transcriptional regulator